MLRECPPIPARPEVEICDSGFVEPWTPAAPTSVTVSTDGKLSVGARGFTTQIAGSKLTANLRKTTHVTTCEAISGSSRRHEYWTLVLQSDGTLKGDYYLVDDQALTPSIRFTLPGGSPAPSTPTLSCAECRANVPVTLRRSAL